MRRVKISVLINSLNYGQFLEAAIKSVLMQNYPRELYEIIVVDAGSTDNTDSILKKYASELKVIYQRGKLGLATGCNLGIKASSGEYILRLDADDAFCQNILFIESLFLDENPDIGFVYPDYLVGENQKLTRVHLPPFQAGEIYRRGDFLGGGTMYRREIFTRYGYYDENLKTIENYELVLRLLKNDVSGLHIELPLFIYNYHQDSMSGNQKLMLETGKVIGMKYGIKYKIGKYHPRNVKF